MAQPLPAYRVKPGSQVEAFHKGGVGANEFCRLLLGPFGSGKSVACCWDAYFLSRAQPLVASGKRHSRWAFVRNTNKQLKETTIKTWLQWFPEGVAGAYYKTDGMFHLTYGDIDAEIYFKALDDPTDVRNLLSLELTGAFLNEAREIDKAIWEGVTGRVGRYPRMMDIVEYLTWSPAPPTRPGRYFRRGEGSLDEIMLVQTVKGLVPTDPLHDTVPLNIVIQEVFWARAPWIGVIADTNPCSTDDYIFRLFKKDAADDETVGALYKLYHQAPGLLKINKRWQTNRAAENLENLRPNYYLTMAIGKDPNWIKIYCCGEFGVISDGKPVYAGFDQSWHVLDFKYDPLLPFFVGWDYGIRGQACTLAQLSTRGQLRVIDETFADGVPLNQFVRDQVIPMIGRYKNAIWEHSAADPAGNKRSDTDESQSTAMLNDMYPGRELGLPFPTYPASTNALATRIGAVAFFLNSVVAKEHNEPIAPRFVIHPRCKNLIDGFMGKYEFKRVQTGEERYKEVPDKNRWSHCADSLQYLCLGILATTDIDGDDPDPYEDNSRNMKRAVNSRTYSGY